MRAHYVVLVVVVVSVASVGCREAETLGKPLPATAAGSSAAGNSGAAGARAAGMGASGTPSSAAGSTAPAPTPESVKVTIDSGVLVGETTGGVDVFRGVPFAKPPVGALRWKAPQMPDPSPIGTYRTSSTAARKSSSEYEATPRTRS